MASNRLQGGLRAQIAFMDKELLDQFVRRFAYGRSLKKIDSMGSHGGHSFYYYCEHCGIPTEAFPEEPIFSPSICCTQCAVLIENCLIESAKGLTEKVFCFNGSSQ